MEERREEKIASGYARVSEDRISEGKVFELSSSNYTDIPQNGDSRKTYGCVYVENVLSEGELMKTVATFVQKVGSVWLQDGLLL